MRNNIFRRTFTKYLVSYILCLVMPVSVFSLLYTTIFLSAYNRQVIEKTSQSLDDTFNNIDLRMINLREISSGILLSRQFANSYLNEYPRLLSFYTVRETLKNYINPNEFIHDIWIYDRNNQCFYNSSLLLSLDSFMRYGPSYSDIEYTFVDIFNKAKADMWIPESNINIFGTDNSFMTYIIVFPYSPTHSNTAAAILINRGFFDRALRAVIPYEKSTAAFFDGEGQIIYNLNHSVNSTLEKILAGKELINGTSIIKTEDGEFFVYTMYSPQNQLRYISLIPYRELTGEVRKHTLIFSVSLLGIMLCGSLLIFLLMQFNYKPISDISRFYNAYSRNKKNVNEEEKHASNEIEQIRKALETISEENRTLSIKNEKFTREEMLFNLLRGNIINPEALIDAGIDPGSGRYAVVIFQLENNKTLQFSDFDTALGKVLDSRLKIHLLEYLEKNSFIGILVWEDETLRIEDTLEILCSEIMKEKKVEIRAACGTQVRQIEDISRSYSEAKTALRYQTGNESQRVIVFQDINMNVIPDYIYIRAEMNTLEESVRAKNSRRTAFIISELIETIKNENTSYFYAVCLCYNIINIFFEEIHRIKNIAAQEIIKRHQSLFLENFDHPVENLITIVLSLSVETMRVLDKAEADTHIVSKDNILKFIDSNYRNSGFCIQTVLDHFDMSLSNLSHQFKSYMGKNISSYINTLKMSYARELLSSGNMTVNEIAEKLGYFQTSSFIKRFKSAESVTPNEYRIKKLAGKQGD